MRHGLEDLEADSHHLRGSRCSNWAPRTLGLGYPKFCLETPDSKSTLGIELLLLPAKGQCDYLSWTKRSHDLRDICLQYSVSVVCLQRLCSVNSALICCPGDGGVAENLTLGLGLRNTLRYALSDLPWGSACCGPAGGNYGQFYFLDVCYKVEILEF